jgi:hypothetical protein
MVRETHYIPELRKLLVTYGVSNPKFPCLCYVRALDWVHGKYFVFTIDPTSIKQYLGNHEEFIYSIYYISVKPGRNVYDVRAEDISFLSLDYGIGNRVDVFRQAVAYWKNNV